MDNGGPAFPGIEVVTEGSLLGGHKEEHKYYRSGMTLLDYFAAKAMQGLINDPHTERIKTNKPISIASYAYELAEAMLAERNKRSR